MEELHALSDTAQKLSTSFISREAGGGVSVLQCVCVCACFSVCVTE